MRNVILVLLVLIGFGSCSESDQDLYTGQKLDFQLYKASDFDYSGTFSVRELIDGNLEVTIQLVGERSTAATTFPAHLHYGSYTDPDAPMAVMLTPVSGADLLSKTVLGTLMDGTKLSFEDMKTFDGHVKVHLANEGPDYEVILVAGNVGSNVEELGRFDAEQMTICSPDF
ncbi:hypothetical protein SAMN04489724_4110 [Algoriphagus locisalis]|uniref:CHRD domain-containing protein n=1 Tax=Algoriphagus locisalis TaxID=305507 RepID=A0A1I7DL56_9BACT|nr:hypothetical protein [Algoriphagus locisalis]SFU12419.1 hypothetical protein SAMN04489724_4110 [Algoriphagus locisalis]